MKRTMMCIITAALLCGVTGCQNTINSVEPEEKVMTPNTISDVRFNTDSFLRDRLLLTKIYTAQTQDGFLQVELEAINVRTGWFSQFWSGLTGSNPYHVRYKFTWFNRDGMEMNTILSDWQDIKVAPGDTVYIKSVAPSRDCADFRISLFEAE